ncbi:MAG: FtsX-like permease family protein [Pseudomonadota bacterium]
MLLNYLLIALYNLKRHPMLSAIKVLSLAIGLGCGLLVLMHAQYEFSFDRHFPNGENIYRLVANSQGIANSGSGPRVAPALRKDYPEIPYITRVRGAKGTFKRGETSLPADYYWVEPDILDVFSLQFVSGDPATALDAPESLLLSETAAAKFFPGQEALGQTLRLDDKVDVRVTGVMRDLPVNTHIDLQVLINSDASPPVYGEHVINDQRSFLAGMFTYLRLPDAVSANAISGDLPNFVERNLPDDQRALATGNQFSLALEPLHDIHLGGRGSGDNTLKVLLSLTAFAVLILLTSCINFANLALVQVQQRSKEVGVRRALGATHTQIVVQFLLDSMLLTLLALVLALPAIELAIPVYTALTAARFTFASVIATSSVAQMVGFVLVTGVLSGLLPALALARFKPALVIKGAGLQGGSSSLPRAGVTVVQFGFSTALILLALAIVMQIRHLSTMDIGFDKDNLLVIDTMAETGVDSAVHAPMVNELREYPGILAISTTIRVPPVAGLGAPFSLPTYGPNETRTLNWLIVDTAYFDTLGLNLIAGRWFSDELATDFHFGQRPTPEETTPGALPAAIITRQAVRTLGFDSPEAALDQVINQRFPVSMSPNRVIGVVEDFHFSGGLDSPSTDVLRATTGTANVLLLRLDPRQQESTLAFIDEVWARHHPGLPINRSFFSDTYNGIVAARTQGISIAATFASVVTIIISAMGLYALVFYSTERRTKEVGIRKVLGATTRMVISLLTWDFLKPVLLACALACIGGYFVIGRYMQQFSSRVEVTPFLYALVTIGTLLIAVLIVVGLSYRAASAHPVQSLRYE